MSEVTLLLGDCLELMKTIPSDSISAVVTDPPYGIGVDTGWLTALHVQRGKPANKSDATLLGDDGTLDLSWLFAYRRWLVFGFPYIDCSAATGWLVWDKWPGLSGGGLGNPVEMAATNAWRGFRISRVLWAGYYRAPGERRYAHPTQKPEAIMRDAILGATAEGDTILDPFMGSGTTGVACVQTGRNFIGMEIDPTYFAIAERRIREAQMQPRLPMETEQKAEQPSLLDYAND